MFSPIWGKGNGCGISGFAVNRGAVNRGFTVYLIEHSLDAGDTSVHLNVRSNKVGNVVKLYIYMYNVYHECLRAFTLMSGQMKCVVVVSQIK